MLIVLNREDIPENLRESSDIIIINELPDGEEKEELLKIHNWEPVDPDFFIY